MLPRGRSRGTSLCLTLAAGRLCAGSELNLAVEAAKELEKDGKVARVVSMVSWELFDEQDASYKESILPKDITARVRSLLQKP